MSGALGSFYVLHTINFLLNSVVLIAFSQTHIFVRWEQESFMETKKKKKKAREDRNKENIMSAMAAELPWSVCV